LSNKESLYFFIIDIEDIARYLRLLDSRPMFEMDYGMPAVM